MQLFISIILLFLGGLLPEESNSISGYVTDSESGETIPFVYLHVEELNRTTTTDEDGYFEISNLPQGELHLAAHRLGYKTTHISIIVSKEILNQEVNIQLTPTLLSSQSIEVVGNEITSGAHLTHVSQKLFGDDLRQNLSSTLAQTLTNIPGISQRTMGSATGRPVIRGLGDERLSILEDGINSGDISDQSSDHAVTIESTSAQEIEIARGPSAFAYGANAVGGIINVVSNKISSNVPRSINGSFSINGESVHTGGATSLSLSVPIKSMVINTNINGRTSLDTQTPSGKIENTYSNSFTSSLGLSYITDWGYLGGSFSYYDNEYGIPPDPNGHPDGVDIDMQKFQYVLKSEYVFDHPFLKVLEANFSINNYNHVEYEAAGSIGTEFGIVTTNAKAQLSHGEIGIFEQGNLGLSFEYEDYAVFGAATPNSNSFSVGAFIIEEKDFEKLHLEAGLRFDHVRNTTASRELFYRIGTITGSIDSTFYKDRSFTNLSSSISAIYSLTSHINVGATLLNSFRAPSLEEQYSEGPHLASYSFEIGNPDLDPEKGFAKEIFLRYNNKNIVLEAAVYHNRFSNYLYAQNTGRRNNSRPDLNDYQFVGVEAVLYGYEFSSEVQFLRNFTIKNSLNYTIGRRDFSESDSKKVPLPMIPPFEFNSSLKYAMKNLEIGSRMILATDQNDLGEFETPTDGYVLLGGFASYRFTTKKILHTLSFNISNLLDETYYNHLSRIKDLNPEAGRNVSLLYRLYF